MSKCTYPVIGTVVAGIVTAFEGVVVVVAIGRIGVVLTVRGPWLLLLSHVRGVVGAGRIGGLVFLVHLIVVAVAGIVHNVIARTHSPFVRGVVPIHWTLVSLLFGTETISVMAREGAATKKLTILKLGFRVIPMLPMF